MSYTITKRIKNIQKIIDSMKKRGFDAVYVQTKKEAAEKAAVADMGDPVEVGISMDRVHRPRLAWSVVAIAVLIGIISSVIHAFMAIDKIKKVITYQTIIIIKNFNTTKIFI